MRHGSVIGVPVSLAEIKLSAGRLWTRSFATKMGKIVVWNLRHVVQVGGFSVTDTYWQLQVTVSKDRSHGEGSTTSSSAIILPILDRRVESNLHDQTG